MSMTIKLTPAQTRLLNRVAAASPVGYYQGPREGSSLAKLISLGLVVCPDPSNGLCFLAPTP